MFAEREAVIGSNFMQTIEERYPIKDLPSVLQYLDREIARSYGCAAHQSTRDLVLARELEGQAQFLEGFRRDVERELKSWKAASEVTKETDTALVDALLSLGWIAPAKKFDLPYIPCSSPA